MSQRDAALLSVQNISNATCGLAGRPSVTAEGHQQAVKDDGAPSGTNPAIIAPGQSAYVRIGLDSACDGGKDPQRLKDFTLVEPTFTIAVPQLSLRGSCSGVLASDWYTQ